MTSGSEHSHPEDVDCWAGCPASPEYPAPRVTNRGTEAWADHPGDSTAEIDYPPETSETGELLALQQYIPEPTLSVDLTIYLPDGVRMSFSEALEVGPGEYTFEDVEGALSGVIKAARGRLA